MGMIRDEVIHVIGIQHPQLIYLTGKSGTGKSTLASKLHDAHGYKVIELDKIVFDAVINPQKLTDAPTVFVDVYRKRDRHDLLDPFIAALQKIITSSQAPLILEGAIANPETLTDVFSGQPFTFIYMHPTDLAKYESFILNRFMLATREHNAGLDKQFWSLVDQKEFENFCVTRKLTSSLQRSINDYVLLSQKESDERLATFKKSFKEILVVDI